MMIIDKRFRNMLVAAGVLVMLMMPFAASAASAADKRLSAGEKWAIDRTTSLTGLTIGKGASITAPEGYTVTMTVDGVETGINAGTYKGDIVLTVAKDVIVVYNNAQNKLRAAITIEDGKQVAEKSVSAAVIGGTVTDNAAKDIKITSNGENFNGIVITGDSKYTISNPVIRQTGNGGNDFAGIGTAIVTDGTSDVTVNNASII